MTIVVWLDATLYVVTKTKLNYLRTGQIVEFNKSTAKFNINGVQSVITLS